MTLEQEEVGNLKGHLDVGAHFQIVGLSSRNCGWSKIVRRTSTMQKEKSKNKIKNYIKLNGRIIELFECCWPNPLYFSNLQLYRVI
jgi:hypothetical protein